jgi:hypothetical protein
MLLIASALLAIARVGLWALAPNFAAMTQLLADRVIERLQNKKVRTAILVFDACRNNPFARSGTRGGRRRWPRAVESPASTKSMRDSRGPI